LWCHIAGFSYAQPSLIGTRLVDYIANLRTEGLTVIYSSDLVPDSLRLESEPSGRTARRRLTSVLDDFDLSLERGPRDTWLIVDNNADVEVDTPEVAVPDRLEPPALPPLENVIVTASRYAFARDPVASGGFLDRLQIETTPSVSDDAMRPVANVPGVSSNGLSGRTTFRGGATDETLILLDGVELVSPFHLKDFESIFGSISQQLVDRMDVYTGGFSTKYGGRMSGVIDIQPIEPAERRHFEAGVSTINTSLLGGGRTANDRSSWLASLRRGNIDLILDAADSDFGRPQYTDFFGRTTTALGRTAQLRVGAISLSDKISLKDGNQTTAVADYDDTYVWAGLTHDVSDALTGEYLLSFAQIDSFRSGASDIPDITTSMLSDRRKYSNATLKANWLYQDHMHHSLEWGVSFAESESDYDFISRIDLPLPIVSPLQQPGTGAFETKQRFTDTLRSAYVNYRWRAKDNFIMELGTRLDDWRSLDEQIVSPRVGAVWRVTDRIALRTAIGRFAQAQRVNEIQVSDRDLVRHRTQRSEQRIVSLEYDVTAQAQLRIELFEKRIEHPRPRFENLFTRLSLLPELLPDRVLLIPERARSEGFELSLDAELRNWRWWLSYSRSTAEDLIDGSWIGRSWQESWAGKSGFVRMGDKWTISASLLVRSGWPISDVVVQGAQLMVPAMNGTTFESFRSVDLKASRRYQLRRGDIEFYFELINALNSNNDCCYEHSPVRVNGGQLSSVSIDTQHWLPSVPVIGFRWSL
jgi:outer membrane cobalamin receptor